MLVHLLRDALVVERAHRRLVRERVAEHDPLRLLAQQRDVLLAHRAVHEQALAGGAALPGAEEARGHGRLRRELEIGVVHHDDRPVAAELEHRRLAGGRLGDLAAGLRRADEADAVRAGVARDLVADDRARPGDEVEDARPADRPRRRTRRAASRTRPSSTQASTRPCCRDASAGAISSAGIVYGQFQGVITPITPRGRRTSSTRFPGVNELASRPSSRLPSSAAFRQ